MTRRNRAIEIADSAIEQIENGSVVPDTPDLLGYALVLVLSDISERLEAIGEQLHKIHALGTSADYGKGW